MNGYPGINAHPHKGGGSQAATLKEEKYAAWPPSDLFVFVHSGGFW